CDEWPRTVAAANVAAERFTDMEAGSPEPGSGARALNSWRRSRPQALGGARERGAAGRQAELHADARVDGGVQERALAADVPAVEAAHGPMKGDVLAPPAMATGRGALDVERRHAPVVQHVPARPPRTRPPVQVLAVHPVALV